MNTTANLPAIHNNAQHGGARARGGPQHRNGMRGRERALTVHHEKSSALLVGVVEGEMGARVGAGFGS